MQNENPVNELGTQNLWEVLQVLGIGYNGVSEALADGKIELSEIFAVLTDLGFKLPAAIADVGQVVPEAKDLTTEEVDELQSKLVALFNAPDHAEQRAMAAVDALQVILGQVVPLLKFAFAGGEQPPNWIPPQIQR
jgi:hypothetical protein